MKNLFNGASVLITGGTGSFGKQFSRIVLSNYPSVKRLIIYSRDEYKQFEMSNLPEFKDNDKLRFFIGDVRDKDRLSRAFEGVDIVIHAAALKQVPSCEYNPFEAIKTNINGAQNVIDAAIDKKVGRVVALSTDKACRPINLYGATKLCSDKLFIAANSYTGQGKTKFAVVRYGNVAGSRGSIIPYLRDLIKKGENHFPITDERMTRFWLRLEEAVDLVLMAINLMQGGELYVKKIPSFRIVDLAKALDPNVQIKIIGIRPGEKLHESMISSEDSFNTFEFPKYYIIKPQYHWWTDKIDNLGKKVEEGFEYVSNTNKEWLSVDDLKTELSKI